MSTGTWLFSTPRELQLPLKDHRKDINGFIQVLQVPLDAPQVVPELICGPVDFFSCGNGGILQELCPPLEEPLGSVHSFLHLPAARQSEEKPRIIISCPAAVTLGQPRVQLSRDATASSQTSFLPTTSCLFCKIRICPAGLSCILLQHEVAHEETYFFRGSCCRVSHRQARAEGLNKAALWQSMLCIPLSTVFLSRPLTTHVKYPKGTQSYRNCPHTTARQIVECSTVYFNSAFKKIHSPTTLA